MLFSAHFIAGGAVGEAINNPIAAFLIGIFVHFILDSIPHYDTTDKGKFTFRQYVLVFGDMIVGACIIFSLIKSGTVLSLSFFAGAIGGVFPDFFDNIPFWKKRFIKTKFGKKYHLFHEFVQQSSKGISMVWGLATQIGIILLSLLAI